MSLAGLKMLEQAAPQALSSLVEHLQAAGDVATAELVKAQGPAMLRSVLDGAKLAAAENEQRGRSIFLAELASRFVIGAFETMEDATDEEVQRVGRRAVRLARALLSEAERQSA